MVATLVLGASLAEVYLRLLNPIDSLLYEQHPRYLFRLIPGARRLFFSREAVGPSRNLVRVNSAGFRGGELRSPRRGLRLVVYGDSFVMASLSPLEETLPVQLARKLEAALGAPVEAVNAGVVGYGPDQECLRIEDEIGPLAPDLIVVAIFAGNDFGDLVRDKIYRLSPDGSLRLNRYSLSRPQVENFPDQPATAPTSMLWRGLELLLQRLDEPSPPRPRPPPETEPAATRGREMSRREYEYFVKIKTYLEKSRREYEDFVVRGNDEVWNLFGDTYNADVSLTPDAPSARYATAAMEQVLVRIEEVATSRHVPVLLVFIPSPNDVCQGPRWAGWERAATAVNPGYRREALTDVLSGIAERHGFLHLDLFQPFRRAGPDRLFLLQDNHWNAAGQELAAEVAKDRIIASAALRPRGQP